MKPTDRELLLHRFLDGELAPAEAAAFEARLLAEPELRERVAHERTLRSGFIAERSAGWRVPAGFTASVVAAARCLPSRQQLQEAEVVVASLHFCRRLLLAAAILTVVGLIWQTGLFHSQATTLEAAPGDVQREMERLDALQAHELQNSEAADSRRGTGGVRGK